MKRFILILFTFLSFSIVKAQDDDPGKKAEKIQALKIAFITQKLDLTTDEAQRFWPVYNRYESELKQVTNNNTGDVLDNEEKLLGVRKKYKGEFVKVLGQPKMNNLFKAEKEFRGVLMKNLRNRQGMKKPMNPRKQFMNPRRLR